VVAGDRDDLDLDEVSGKFSKHLGEKLSNSKIISKLIAEVTSIDMTVNLSRSVVAQTHDG
jgi:hypothetical protein